MRLTSAAMWFSCLTTNHATIIGSGNEAIGDRGYTRPALYTWHEVEMTNPFSPPVSRISILSGVHSEAKCTTTTNTATTLFKAARPSRELMYPLTWTTSIKPLLFKRFALPPPFEAKS
ncbi:hypothetical protein F5Y09DRAFT_293433 [Xylaria sp. FL1042]|nr:hypothetical protein F5Y09DRAFT_293296 [Xylaria sp. FL1042]KAI0435372.1 hypothetical protein F5Y09DRAFT_293433 [Xylaria sp. FL1042]